MTACPRCTRKDEKIAALQEVLELPENSVRRILAKREEENEERGKTIAKLRSQVQEMERLLAPKKGRAGQ